MLLINQTMVYHTSQRVLVENAQCRLRTVGSTCLVSRPTPKRIHRFFAAIHHPQNQNQNQTQVPNQTSNQTPSQTQAFSTSNESTLTGCIEQWTTSSSSPSSKRSMQMMTQRFPRFSSWLLSFSKSNPQWVSYSIKQETNQARTMMMSSSEEHNLCVDVPRARHQEGSGARKYPTFQDGRRLFFQRWIHHFLPHGYPLSVPGGYASYGTWQFSSGVLSSVNGVLAMQSLLHAVGLGQGAIPMAAALNWIIKDGLGQFGGVLFASMINNRFDADPKRWRMISSILLDLSTFIEIITPCYPHLFVPLASVANIGKNICWLSASATRAGIHYSFALKENLADITAKAGSQSIAASMIGTAIGVTISPIIGTSVVELLSVFTVLSTLHLYSMYRSLCYVAIPSLNRQRMELLTREYMNNPHIFPTVEDIRRLESFIPTLFSGYRTSFKNQLFIGTSIPDIMVNSAASWVEMISLSKHEKYLINAKTTTSNTVEIHLVFEDQATSQHVIKGFFHGIAMQQALETHLNSMKTIDAKTCRALLKSTYEEINTSWNGIDAHSKTERLIAKLEESDWHTTNLLFEENIARYRFK